MADEEAQPNVVLTFRDRQGRKWLAAGYLGELTRYEGKYVVERQSLQSFHRRDLSLTEFKVIERASGSAVGAEGSTT